MLGTLKVTFNQADFIKKLRHYATDSAPILLNIAVGSTSVTVKGSGSSVIYDIDPSLSIKDNIHFLIERCENLYPKMVKKVLVKKQLSVEERKIFFMQGLSLEEILKKTMQEEDDYYTIVRVSFPSMSIVYRHDKTKKKYLAKFSMPLIKILEKLDSLSPEERFLFVEKNSSIKEM